MVCSCEELVEMQMAAAETYVHPSVIEYISDIVVGTRKHSSVKLGISPRGTLAMLRASKSYAYITGRDYVVPEDVKALAVPVFAHRIVLSSGFGGEMEKKRLIEDIVAKIIGPTEEWKK